MNEINVHVCLFQRGSFHVKLRGLSRSYVFSKYDFPFFRTRSFLSNFTGTYDHDWKLYKLEDLAPLWIENGDEFEIIKMYQGRILWQRHLIEDLASLQRCSYFFPAESITEVDLCAKLRAAPMGAYALKANNGEWSRRLRHVSRCPLLILYVGQGPLRVPFAYPIRYVHTKKPTGRVIKQFWIYTRGKLYTASTVTKVVNDMKEFEGMTNPLNRENKVLGLKELAIGKIASFMSYGQVYDTNLPTDLKIDCLRFHTNNDVRVTAEVKKKLKTLIRARRMRAKDPTGKATNYRPALQRFR